MAHRILSLAVSALITLPLLAQVECPPLKEFQRRASEGLLRDDRLRSLVGARPRLLRVSCEQREKDAQRVVAIAWVVGYETGAGAEVTLGADDFRAVEMRKMPGHPQSSEEEREEARAIIRENARVAGNAAIEGGFVVDPPPGSPPGRYLIFLISARARNVPIEEVVVDLTRRAITPRRKY